MMSSSRRLFAAKEDSEPMKDVSEQCKSNRENLKKFGEFFYYKVAFKAGRKKTSFCQRNY